jgi:hypothetical protein
MAGILGSDRIDTWFRKPRVNPSKSLCQTGMVADEVRIIDIGEQVLARGALRILYTLGDRELDGN